jgi:hypothetical protein
MKILSKGSINSLINDVCVSPMTSIDCRDFILSVPRLLSAGINVLFLAPDTKNQGVGSILFDKEGNILSYIYGIGNQDCTINFENIKLYKNLKMEIPTIKSMEKRNVNAVSVSMRKRVRVLNENRTQRVRSLSYIYGLKKFYRVAMMRSEPKFLWMSKTLKGFPVSEGQILNNTDNGDMVNLLKTGNMKRHKVDNGV